MFRKILLVFVALLALANVAYILWSENAPPAGEAAQIAMEPSDDLTVSHEEGLSFLPKTPKKTAFIFYSGARVRPEAYAPPLRPIADAGYAVFVPQMPFNTAIVATGKAEEIIKAHPEFDQWVIGGHSLGGTSAAMFLDKHQSALAGIIFWASYPANSDNLSGYEGEVLSISATLDGLSTPAKVDAAKALLPDDATYVVIDGGNHGQFGDYGPQFRDNPATISPEDQWEQVAETSLEILNEVEGSFE